MTTYNNRSAVTPTTGTLAAWNDMLAQDKALKQSRMDWLCFFARQASLGTVETINGKDQLTALPKGDATKLSKAAVTYAARTLQVIPVACDGISCTTLNKRSRAGAYDASVMASISALWSLETRARQIEAATAKASEPPVINNNPEAAKAVAETSTVLEKAEIVPVDKKTGKKLPAIPAVKVARVELEHVLSMLDTAISNEDLNGMIDVRKRVAALLA